MVAATPNFAVQEMSLGIHYNTGGHDLPTYLADQSLITLDDGYVQVPEGPGLGVVLDEQVISGGGQELRQLVQSRCGAARMAASRSGSRPEMVRQIWDAEGVNAR